MQCDVKGWRAAPAARAHLTNLGKMNRFKLITGVILVFLVGLLTGAVIAGFYFKERISVFAAGGPPESEVIRRPIIVGFKRGLINHDAFAIILLLFAPSETSIGFGEPKLLYEAC